MFKHLATYLLVLSTLFTPTHAFASSEFATSFYSTYTINDSLAQVTHKISLKNNLSHIYATSYTLATSGSDLAHITATDENGPLSTTITEQNGLTTIAFNIAKPAIGKDQVKTINLSYETSEVVEKIGDTTTINIPRLAKANEAESYTRVINLPSSDNQHTLIYPPQTRSEPSGEYTSYIFDGHQNDSLTILVGDSATYHLSLDYELKNKELKNITSELALPPDTSYQHIVIDQLDPPPSEIQLDDSGNWLARYNLRPQEKILVHASLYATVYPLPKLKDPSATHLNKTLHSKYWDTTSAPVVELAKQLTTPQKIYDYLVSNFTYNYSGLTSPSTRLGSLKSLTLPGSVLCTEFTDTFVALARYNQIPAREINGFGYTKNTALQPQNTTTDILHSWPEYYDPARSSWVSIDPTWGNTTGGIDYYSKLDFSHITFVRHGAEDSYPLPAGAYKSVPTDKYVRVELADTKDRDSLSYKINESGDTLRIVNDGNVALLDQEISHAGQVFKIDYLPPYGTRDITLTSHESWLDRLKQYFLKLATWAHIR